MDFWVDMALSVLFRVLKDSNKIAEFAHALIKLRDILNSLPLDTAAGPPTTTMPPAPKP